MSTPSAAFVVCPNLQSAVASAHAWRGRTGEDVFGYALDDGQWVIQNFYSPEITDVMNWKVLSDV